MSKDTAIKAGTYCPICRGIPASDCWHDASSFSVPRTDFKSLDAIVKLEAENEALKQQVEQGKREAVPEGLIESVARAIYMQWRDADGYLHWQAGGNSLMQDSARRIAATAIAAAPKQEK